MEAGLLTDATSRNSLYKIHVSLGKIVNTLDEQQGAGRLQSRSVSVVPDTQPAEGKTVVEEPVIKEEDEESDGTAVPQYEQGTVVGVSDDEDTKMQE